MNEVLKDKKLHSVFGAVSLLLIILSVFFIIKIFNEIKSSKHIGADSQYRNVIYVSGEGEVKAISDIASLYINLKKEASTAKEAQEFLNESIAETLTYLKEQKIEDKDIKSEYSGISPKYSYEKVYCYTYPCPPNDPKIVGYTASQSIAIKVRDVDNANIIKTGLAGIGVTDLTGPTFLIDDQEAFEVEARGLAIKDAREKAEVLAKDLGVKLGKIVDFSEGGNNGYFPMMYKTEARMESAVAMDFSAPELPKGENTIYSNVIITYEIR